MFDIVIRNGLIVDGSGSPGYKADLGICGGRIAEIGELGSSGARIIDVDGCIVAPGFIDIHGHNDEMVLANPTSESKVTQGVTTEVSGNCGYSAAPRGGRRNDEDSLDEMAECGMDLDWKTMGEFLARLDSTPMTINFATLVGHGMIRSVVMGCEDRQPTRDELTEMKSLVYQSIEAGAFGLSTGLIYPPGCFSQTEELIELCRTAADCGGIYATHMRSEGDRLIEGVEEALRIGRESGIGVQISHHKASGQRNWGKVVETLSMIDDARASGLDVWADQYPYVATSTSLGVLLPDWAHDGGKPALLARLRDPGLRLKLRDSLAHDASEGWIAATGGWDTVVISSVRQEWNRRYEGLNISEVAEVCGKHPTDAVLDLLLDEQGSVGMIHFVIDEKDVQTVMRHPAVVVGSDSTARSMSGPLSHGKPHPRSFGTFPRVLGKYVREDGVLTIEEAVAKMTGRTAKRLSLYNRGLLAAQFFADITVFDPETIADTATFVNPHGFAKGIRYVLVNGEIVVDDGHLLDITQSAPGRVLRHGVN